MGSCGCMYLKGSNSARVPVRDIVYSFQGWGKVHVMCTNVDR